MNQIATDRISVSVHSEQDEQLDETLSVDGEIVDSNRSSAENINVSVNSEQSEQLNDTLSVDGETADVPQINFEQLTGLELPYLVIHTIIDSLCSVDISSYFSLSLVCKYFKYYIDKKQKHRFHLNALALNQLKANDSQPILVSVNRLIRAVGKGSSLVLELRAAFQNPRWNTAWLYLMPVGYGWYEIAKVFWKHH